MRRRRQPVVRDVVLPRRQAWQRLNTARRADPHQSDCTGRQGLRVRTCASFYLPAVAKLPMPRLSSEVNGRQPQLHGGPEIDRSDATIGPPKLRFLLHLSWRSNLSELVGQLHAAPDTTIARWHNVESTEVEDQKDVCGPCSYSSD